MIIRGKTETTAGITCKARAHLHKSIIVSVRLAIPKAACTKITAK